MRPNRAPARRNSLMMSLIKFCFVTCDESFFPAPLPLPMNPVGMSPFVAKISGLGM